MPYEDVGVLHGTDAIVRFAFQGGAPTSGFPVRAPPILQRGDFLLCGTNVRM